MTFDLSNDGIKKKFPITFKILHVIPFFSPKFGGSVTTVYGLTKSLTERGHDVTILTTDFHFDKKFADGLEGVKVIPVEYLFNWGLFIYTPKIKTFLKNNLQDFDIIMLHEYRSYQNAIVSKYAKKYSIPFCLDAHGTLLPFWHWRYLKKIYDLVWGKRILNSAAYFIASTTDEKQQYSKYGVDSKKVQIIPRGIDITQYNVITDSKEFKKRYSIDPDAFLILFLGRIHSIKGLDLLIDAFSKLLKSHENAILIIAGSDDGYLPQLNNLISKFELEQKVILTGHLFGNEKIQALKSADLVVVPSYYESFGNVIIEAMASKTPVLVSNKCGILQMLPKEIMHICECDKDSLYDSIQRLILDGSYRKKYVLSAYEFAEINFSWQNIVKKYEKLFKTIINKELDT